LSGIFLKISAFQAFFIFFQLSDASDFAYKNPKHREMVLINKKMKWFSEELFARFTPYKIEGQWNNQDASLLIKNANSIKTKISD
jgi:hypothetical protein